MYYILDNTRMNFQPATSQNSQSGNLIKSAGENIGTAVNSIKTNINDSVTGFSSQVQAGSSATQQFLQSNTIVAKFAFLVLILFVFLFLLGLGISLIQYFITPQGDPYVIKGLINGNNAQTISTDPSQSNSVVIYRSNNQSKGLEFTWSVWIYIDDVIGNANQLTSTGQNVNISKYQHIFNKGDNSPDPITNVASVNNGPGLYLSAGNYTDAKQPHQAILHVIMNTSSTDDDQSTIDIDNIPIKKWVHVAMRMQNTIFDVYINGVVSGRLIMQQVPKQNYNNINVCQNGGFQGKMSNLRYYSHALNAFEINNVVSGGPNLTTNSLDSTATSYGSYLSNMWYSSKM
jgi:Concanavalin A-like lectin/glucanases superfamily